MGNYTPDVITIHLTKGLVTAVDAIDSDLQEVHWNALERKGYISAVTMVSVKGRLSSLYMHRVILSRMIGRELTKGEVVDHIDGDPLNNRRTNLRLATQRQNLHNSRKHKNSTSPYKGISQRKDRWRAMIRIDGKNTHLGYFDTPEEAHEAYCAAALQHFGNFARFN